METEHIESNVDSYTPETGDKGKSLDVNADNLTVGGANDFAIEREAVFSLESSIHQLLRHTASATVTGRKQSFNDACGDDFPSESAPHCWIGLERKALPTSALTWRTEVTSQ